ncbi:MAG: rimO [Verrucomicrobiales bacterium]|nr:rimO [Verrucomicrobiales bacterium]
MKSITSNPTPPIKVGLISLGCAKNLVDAEIMLGTLMKEGVEITNQAEIADVIIVNTCSFIDAAQEESVDTILESSEVRDVHNRGQGLVVSGCLSQRFRDQLPTLFPEVDAFMGIDQVAQVGKIVRDAIEHRTKRLAEGNRPRADSKRKAKEEISRLDAKSSTHSDEASLKGTAKLNKTKVVVAPQAPVFDVTDRPKYIPEFDTPRFRLTPSHFAYLKIAEGCNHPCSFCIIPRMRGSHRSRSQADVVAEARQLIKDGVKEINLISQDSTYYGLDLRPERNGSISSPEKFKQAAASLPAGSTTLSSLLKELNALEGDFWIRLLYTHPAHWTDELIETIAACKKVARYVDMPLQHIHGNMLERMRRETSEEYIVELVKRIRKGIPGIAIRTTFIVGFPGETEEYFKALLQFMRDTEFERLGIFSYSQEEGTRAGSMEQQVPEGIKKRRKELAMSVQAKVAEKVSERYMGKTIRVLVEKEANSKELQNANVSSWEHGHIRNDESAQILKGKYLVSRGEADAPDIDGRVYIKGSLPIGQFALVKVIGHTLYDLIAKPVS